MLLFSLFVVAESLSVMDILSKQQTLMITTISNVLTSIYAILVILGMDTQMIKLIVNTFDFWYKMYNLFIVSVCWILIDFDSSQQFEITFWLVYLIIIVLGLLILFVFFAMDAVMIDNRKKNIILCIVVLVSLTIEIEFFFTKDDVIWNPFGNDFNKYTRISFKSLLLSSWMNLILFMAKPVLTNFRRALLKFKRQCCNVCGFKSNNTSANHTSNNNVIQSKYNHVCDLLYKRPKIEWF